MKAADIFAPKVELIDLMKLSRVLTKERTTFQAFILMRMTRDATERVSYRDLAAASGLTVSGVRGYLYRTDYWIMADLPVARLSPAGHAKLAAIEARLQSAA